MKIPRKFRKPTKEEIKTLSRKEIRHRYRSLHELREALGLLDAKASLKDLREAARILIENVIKEK